MAAFILEGREWGKGSIQEKNSDALSGLGSASSVLAKSWGPFFMLFLKAASFHHQAEHMAGAQKALGGLDSSTQLLKDDLICKVYLQESCSLNNRFLP